MDKKNISGRDDETAFVQGTLYPWISLNHLQIDADQIELVKRIGTTKVYKAGAVIHGYGEKKEGFYFLHQGEVSAGILATNGLEKTIFIFEPPCYVGEVLYFTNKISNMIVTAVKDSRVTFLNREAVDQLLDNRQFCETMVRFLTRKVYTIVDQITDQFALTPLERVYKILVFYGETFGNRESEQIAIQISQEKIADITGLHRVTVARMIKELRRLGVVRKVSKAQIVLNRQKISSQV